MKEIHINEEKHTINIYYINSKLNDYSFPETLSDFQKDIQILFNISPNIISDINYILKENNTKIKDLNFKTEESYKKEISEIKSLNKDKDIDIYIENNYSEIFEENIKILVENEIKSAADRIINGLKYKGKKDEIKIKEKQCNLCQQYIEGDMYKSFVNNEEQYFCEKCSLGIEEPMFIIH